MDSNENITDITTRPLDTTCSTTWKNMSPTFGGLNTTHTLSNCVNNKDNLVSSENVTNRNYKLVCTEPKNYNGSRCPQDINNDNYNNLASDMMIDSLNVNEGYQKLESRATLPKAHPKGKKKSTWRDVSPRNSNECLVGKKMSDSFGSPKRSRSWDVSQSSNNQTVTWKDLSPTKVKEQVRQKPGRKKRPESGYYSNDVQSEGHDSREEFDSLSGSDQVSSARRSSSSSPDDAGFSEYYYDEDFTVKFDSNIRNSSMKVKDEEEEYAFPQTLNGSYTRFGNLRESLSHPDLYTFGNYESELSGSRTSMEISSSEREMMCSSDMLEFSNDPLFTPTPTGDIAAQMYSTDSLARDQANSSSRTSGDGKLTVDCCPRKDEYFLSFNSSSQGQSTASLSSNSYASQTSSQDGLGTCSHSCSSNDGEEICSNSFHFCQAGQGDGLADNNCNLKMDALQERSMEKSASTDASKSSSEELNGRSSNCNHKSPHNSPKSSPKKQNLTPSKGTYGSLDGQQKALVSDTKCSIKRVKRLTSWKQVKNLKQFGILCNSTDRVHSMPDLCGQNSWGTSVKNQLEPRGLQEISDSFHNKRHSSSLLELYQRMKSPTSMVSLDTIRAVEQILFPENSINEKFNSEYSANSSESSFDGSDHSCDCRFQEDSRNSSRNSCNVPRYNTPISTYNRSTAISADKVTLWHGTRNFASQFPPKTNDCGVQACFDEPEPTPVSNQSQQTSPNSHREIMNILEDIGEHESRKLEKEVHHRKTVSEPRQRSKESRSSRRSYSSSPSRYNQPKYYSHRSLPDLSFLGPSSSMDFSSESSLFDPVKIPIILTPVVDDSRQTQSSQRESGYCSCHKEKHHSRSGHRCSDSSTSSGVSTSSTSSSFDNDCYNCQCCHSLAKDLERILFQPPHLECAQKYLPRPDSSHHLQHHDRCDSGYDHYSSLSKRRSTRKMNSSSSSNSTSSLHLEKLYSVKEESPTSPEKHGKIQTGSEQVATGHGQVYRGYHLSGNMEKRYHNREYYEMEDSENGMSIEIQEDHCGRKPLKSCLRKIDKACRSRSLSNPDNLNAQLHESNKPHTKPNRYSIACDSLFPQAIKQEDNTVEAEEQKEAAVLDAPSEASTSVHDENKEHDVQTDSMDEANKANKRVSFASEVLFQSPQCSPQVSPHRLPAAARVASIEMEDEELRVEISVPVPPEKPKRMFAETPPVEFQVSPTLDSDQGNEELMELNRKIALLSNITHAANTLVKHFAHARDPFDKLRLGSVAETPEIGTLVFKELCPAVELVIEDGMKPHRTGLHVFGKIHITPWRIAEMSAELGPYTRSINQLVKELKSRPNLLSNKQRFYAFIAGLLNLRLLDFWVGYVQTKEDLVEQVYNPESIMRLSKQVLDQQFNVTLTALLPLSALPFQMDYDLVAQTPPATAMLKNDTSKQVSEKEGNSNLPKSVSDSEQLKGSSKKILDSFGNSLIPKAKSVSSIAIPKFQDGPKKLSTFTGRKSGIAKGLPQSGTGKGLPQPGAGKGIPQPGAGKGIPQPVNGKGIPHQSRIPVVGSGGSPPSRIPVPGSSQQSRIPKVASKVRQIPVLERSSDSSSSNDPKSTKTTWAQQSPPHSPTKKQLKEKRTDHNDDEGYGGNITVATVTGLTQKFMENRSLESSAGSGGSVEKGDDSSSSLSMKAILDESPIKTKNQATIDITTLIDKLLLSNNPLQSTSDEKATSPVKTETESDTVINNVKGDKISESVNEIDDNVLGSDEQVAEKPVNSQPNSTFAVIEASPIMHAQTMKSEPSWGCGQSELDLKRDEFRITEFRYCVALLTSDSDDADQLSYEDGDYLEVLAQLDSDWLYCAKGSQEGLVQLSAVRPLKDSDEFDLMHNDFYH